MKLRPFTFAGTLSGYNFYCPGCAAGHPYYVPRWTFDGNMQEPTFTPSLRLFHPGHTDPDTGIQVPEQTLCHLFLTKGRIHYCGDCLHPLAGHSVDMVEFPTYYDTPD